MGRALVNEVAIVTGGSSGIGAATARELARRGARVALAARRADMLEAQVQAILDAGGQAISVPTDVTDVVQVRRLVEQTRQSFGHVDILVNCAGINWAKLLAETSADEIVKLVEINLLGAMLVTREVLPEMLQQHRGVIISVGSVQSRVALEPLYSATKFGMRGFSMALRRQIAGTGVFVSLVMPGNIRTPMTSALQGRMSGPELIGSAIAQLVIHPRREVIVPWQYHLVVWLDQLVPRLADYVFWWRHRNDHASSGYGYLPAGAHPVGTRAPN